MSKNPRLRFKKADGSAYPDWQMVKLGDVAERVTRKNSDNQCNNLLTISAEHGLINQEEFFLKQIASKENSHYILLKEGEFSYNKSYSKNYPWGVVKCLQRYKEGVISNLYIFFKFNENLCNNYFFIKYFETSLWHNYMPIIAQEGARNHGLLNVSIKDFFTLPIPLPHADEQGRIARFFSALDDQITAQQTKIDQLTLFKKSMLQRMFSEEGNPALRFQKSDGSAYPDWQTVKLGDVCEIVRGLSYNSSNVQSDGLLVLRSNNIQNGSLDLSSNQLQFVNTSCSDVQQLQIKDIVICMANGSKNLVGKSTEYLGQYPGMLTVGAFCAIIRPKNSFIKYVLQTDGYRKFIDLSLAGTNINNLKSTDLQQFSFPLPHPDEQGKIARFFSVLDDQITAHQTKLQHLTLFKKSLLQRMFI